MKTAQPLSRRAVLLGLGGSTFALTACGNIQIETGRPLGHELNEGNFGAPTRNNIGVHNGDIDYTVVLGQRFAREVPTTINFAFNSAQIDGAARAILDQQAAFIRAFPEVQFSVYGHTDAVGSNAYNRRLGRRRAQAVVNYFASRGISRNRLRALVSFGEAELLVHTQDPEMRNRRTVTEVTGFMSRHPMVLDGRYAEIVYRNYRGGGGEG